MLSRTDPLAQAVNFEALEKQHQEVTARQAERETQRQEHVAAVQHYAAQQAAYQQELRHHHAHKTEAEEEMHRYEDHGREKRKAAEAARRFAQEVRVDVNVYESKDVFVKDTTVTPSSTIWQHRWSIIAPYA